MKQELTDIPRTQAEAERQKGPTPAVAVWLAIALIAAFVLFFVPAFFQLDIFG